MTWYRIHAKMELENIKGESTGKFSKELIIAKFYTLADALMWIEQTKTRHPKWITRITEGQ